MDASDVARPPCALRPTLGRDRGRLERSDEVGLRTRPWRASRGRPPRRLPRQPKRRRGVGSYGVSIARRATRFAGARRGRGSGAGLRGDRRRRARGGSTRTRRHHGGARGEGRGGTRPRAGCGGSSPGGRRGAARAELPRSLRRRRRAGHRLERASGGRDRPHLAERQPRPRARADRNETTASASRVSSRSATRPTSRPPSS